MNIQLSPFRGNAPLVVSRAGDVLTINGEVFDFTSLVDGDEIPEDEISGAYFAGPVTRVSGAVHLTLRLPHGPNAPTETRFPAPLLDPPDGPLTLPDFDAE